MYSLTLGVWCFLGVSMQYIHMHQAVQSYACHTVPVLLNARLRAITTIRSAYAFMNAVNMLSQQAELALALDLCLILSPSGVVPFYPCCLLIDFSA